MAAGYPSNVAQTETAVNVCSPDPVVPVIDIAGLNLSDPACLPSEQFVNEVQEALADVGFFYLSGICEETLQGFLNVSKTWFEERPFGPVEDADGHVHYVDESARLAANNSIRAYSEGGNFLGRGYMSALKIANAPERCSIDFAQEQKVNDWDHRATLGPNEDDQSPSLAISKETFGVSCCKPFANDLGAVSTADSLPSMSFVEGLAVSDDSTTTASSDIDSIKRSREEATRARARMLLQASGFMDKYMSAPNPKDFDDRLERMVHEELIPFFTSMGRKLLQAICLALTGDLDGLSDFAGIDEHPDIMKRPWWYFRLLYYPKQDTVRYIRAHHNLPQLDEDLLMAPHTDFGWLTLLLQSKTVKPSLEIRMKDGEWVGVHPLPGAIIVNVGDMMSAWSGNRVQAREHRVVAGDPDTSRVSIPFFYNPCLDACLEGGGEWARSACDGRFTTENWRKTMAEEQEAASHMTYGMHLAKRLGYNVDMSMSRL